jgi:sarcosine oxidase subunit delta
MQLFPCPFCGPRDETEFSFATEAGNARPVPAADVTAETWARYLHFAGNPKGATREVWLHQTCGEFFVIERDTVSHVVGEGEAAR